MNVNNFTGILPTNSPLVPEIEKNEESELTSEEEIDWSIETNFEELFDSSEKDS